MFMDGHLLIVMKGILFLNGVFSLLKTMQLANRWMLNQFQGLGVMLFSLSTVLEKKFYEILM